MPKAASNKSLLPDSSKLSIPELTFITEYLKNGHNGTQAYLALKPHVTSGTASVEASELIRKPHIIEYMQAIKDRMAAASELTKSTLIEYASYGLMIAKQKEDIGVLFRGLDVSAKLIHAYDSSEDDLSLYSSLINKIQGKNIQINIGCKDKDSMEIVGEGQGERAWGVRYRSQVLLFYTL